MTENLAPEDWLDQATRNRLAKLGAVPVDISAAKSHLHRIVGQARSRRTASRWLAWPTWAGLASAAAIALAAMLTFDGTQSAAYAAPAEMVKLHRELVSGQTPAIPVGDIEQARKVIQMQWPDAPTLPALRGDNIHACCLKGIQSRRVACVLMRHDDVPVTVVVAKAQDLRSAQGPAVIRDGRRYTVQSRDGVNMVMTRHEDRWLCFMGEMPRDELIRLAQAVAH